MRSRNMSIAEVASVMDVAYHTLYTTLTGRALLCDEVREWLPKILGLPIEKVFTQELLTHKDQRGRGRRQRDVSMLTTFRWWPDGVQQARDLIIENMRNQMLLADEDFASLEPTEEILSHDPLIIKYTWKTKMIS